MNSVIAYDFMPLETGLIIAEILIFLLVIASLINIIRYTHYGIKLYKIKLKKEKETSKET